MSSHWQGGSRAVADDKKQNSSKFFKPGRSGGDGLIFSL